MGTRLAHRVPAHLLEVNEGVDAVLPNHCDAPHSTYLRAGVTHTVGENGSIVEVKKRKKEPRPTETVISQLAGDHSRWAWSVGHGRGSPPLGAAGGWSRKLKLQVARPTLSGMRLARSQVARPPVHALASGRELRLRRWLAPDRWYSEMGREELVARRCSATVDGQYAWCAAWHLVWRRSMVVPDCHAIGGSPLQA